MRLEIIRVVILVVISLDIFMSTTRLLFLVVGIVIVTIAFSNFTSFAFNFLVFTIEGFSIISLVD